ncbi:hypothetical protein [Streptomyces sp. NWU49]|uniref:hypothetical protein n=1 Tax=Streptomyces sp. NWU49 TaxID=2201153 RepID=UPI0011B42D64|nr:hypothetical protein [Streptomyces sp. NWU49]
MMRQFGLTALVISTMLVAGCSGNGPEYGYATPKKICDVNVAVSDVQPLLPPGEAIKESSRGTPGESRSCGMVVDERVDLSVSFSRQTGEVDIAREADDDYIGLRRVSLGGAVKSAAVADDGAVAWMACSPKPDQPQYETPEAKAGRYTHLVLEIHTGGGIKKPDNIKEWRAHIEKFLRAYVPELIEAWCA